MLLLLFYRAASEGWQPPMSKEDTRESSLTQKCYWHRIIPEVGGHFDPCTKQGTPTIRRRPPLVDLKECSQMHKRGWNNIEKSFSLLLIAIVRVESHQVTLANWESLLAQEMQEERNPNRPGSQKALLGGGQFWKTQKSSSSAPIVDHAEYPITASYGSLGGRLHYSAPVAPKLVNSTAQNNSVLVWKNNLTPSAYHRCWFNRHLPKKVECDKLKATTRCSYFFATCVIT